MNGFLGGTIKTITSSGNGIEVTVENHTMIFKTNDRFFLKRPNFNNGEVSYGEAKDLQVGDFLIKPWDIERY